METEISILKEDDLMIGDWIQLDGHTDYNRVQEIARDEDGRMYISFAASATLFRAYQFAPVELMPEIWHKDEFFNVKIVETGIDTNTGVMEYSLVDELSKDKKVFTIKHDTVNNVFYLITPYKNIPFKYVHEFQHILRLYGYGLFAKHINPNKY